MTHRDLRFLHGPELTDLLREAVALGDTDTAYRVRREIDRRAAVPKPSVHVNFEEEYLTD